MGLSPYPGFAHNAHAARLDCDLYHPSFGGEASTVWAGALEDDGTSEFDLCLDDQENWSIYLRFSEISDIGNTRLRTLADASVNIVTGSDSKNISLMELRPGGVTTIALVSSNFTVLCVHFRGSFSSKAGTADPRRHLPISSSHFWSFGPYIAL